MVALSLLSFLLTTPQLAAAEFGYIGPGAGLGMLGALLAVVAFLFLALLGPILYPLRMLRRRLRRNRADETAENSDGEKLESSG